MADSEVAGLTEDTTPDATDNVYAQDAAGAVDKRVPLSALSTVTTTAATVNAAGAVMESDYDANTVLAATSDNTPVALTVAEQTLVGRITSGAIAALSAAQVRTLLDVPTTGEAVLDTLFDANTILAANTDNTPAALTMGASTILARLAAGNIVAATPAELRTLLALVIGTNVQAWDADLDDIAGIADVQGDIIVRGAAGWERLAKSATATHVLTAGASQPGWAAPSGGGGSDLIALKVYSGTLVTASTTSATFVDVDATNAAVTFTVPASGAVLITCRATTDNYSAQTMQWNLREASSDVSGTNITIGYLGVRDIVSTFIQWYVSGLTPSASVTYKLGQARTFGSTGAIATSFGGTAGDGALVLAVRTAT